MMLPPLYTIGFSVAVDGGGIVATAVVGTAVAVGGWVVGIAVGGVGDWVVGIAVACNVGVCVVVGDWVVGGWVVMACNVGGCVVVAGGGGVFGMGG